MICVNQVQIMPAQILSGGAQEGLQASGTWLWVSLRPAQFPPTIKVVAIL